jgi:small conductance mechanosensitive channel
MHEWLDDHAATLLLIAVVTGGAHALALALPRIARRSARSRFGSEAKAQTLTSFVTSLLVFAVYFAAIGFVLGELGVSLTTYLASASVIGLAVSFGSQGIVQDVITGLTVVFSDLLDVGDLVEIGGQVGIVERVGIRFTVLVNFNGARVFVPNRTVANVINHPRGYTRSYVDVRLPEDETCWPEAEARVDAIARGAHAQYPGTLLVAPTVEGRFEADGGWSYLRVKFRIWPGQGALLDQAVKPAICRAMRSLQPAVADWRVSVHHRAESRNPQRRLPRPFAIAHRRRDG